MNYYTQEDFLKSCENDIDMVTVQRIARRVIFLIVVGGYVRSNFRALRPAMTATIRPSIASIPKKTTHLRIFTNSW